MGFLLQVTEMGYYTITIKDINKNILSIIGAHMVDFCRPSRKQLIRSIGKVHIITLLLFYVYRVSYC